MKPESSSWQNSWFTFFIIIINELYINDYINDYIITWKKLTVYSADYLFFIEVQI